MVTLSHVAELQSIAGQVDVNTSVLSGMIRTLHTLVGEVADCDPELMASVNTLLFQVLQDHEQVLNRLRSVTSDVQAGINQRN